MLVVRVGQPEGDPRTLGHRAASQEFLRRFLADPAATATHSGAFRMPNLGLTQQEIAALVAFLNAGKP